MVYHHKYTEKELDLIFNDACSRYSIEFWDAYRNNADEWPLSQKFDYIITALEEYFRVNKFDVKDVDLTDKVEKTRQKIIEEEK